MYDELVKRLREHGEFLTASDKMKATPNVNVRNVFAEDYAQAADVIEKLLSERDEVNADSWKTAFEVERDEHRWIPVTERLPERHKNVLCCGARGGMFVGWFTNISAISDGKTIAYVHGGNGRYVTHWMLLPEPPKEE